MFVAVDSCVLMHLAEGVEDTLDALGTLRQRLPTARIIATATVLQELHFFATDDEFHKRDLACAALAGLRHHRIEPVNLIPVGHGIVEITANKLRDRGLLPHEERNDALIIAEAALLGCSILISSDAHMLAIPYTSLKLALDECHVQTPLICSPSKVVRNFFS